MRLGEPARMQAAINITPLVDVVLVLLIIFMVVVPLLLQGYDAGTPRVSAEAGERDRRPHEAPGSDRRRRAAILTGSERVNGRPPRRTGGGCRAKGDPRDSGGLGPASPEGSEFKRAAPLPPIPINLTWGNAIPPNAMRASGG